MKVDVTGIVGDHLSTMKTGSPARVSIWNLILFYAMPAFIAGACFYLELSVRSDAYSVGITFYGILIGLLINIQVVIFGIFQRAQKTPDNRRAAEMAAERSSLRNELIDESSSNISYLILVCCVACVVLLLFFNEKWETGWPPAIAAGVMAHFFLTLLMIVKRLHALFAGEYRGEAS